MKKILSFMAVIAMSIVICNSSNAQKPSAELLTPTNHVMALIDYQGQMAFATNNIHLTNLRNNTAMICGASKVFNVPTIVTTVDEESFSGPVFPEVELFYPKAKSKYIDRTTMNAWEDVNFHKAAVAAGKRKIVMAGLWTTVCIVEPVLSAIDEGYEVYIITDACGDVSVEAQDMAVRRMIQAGARPMTSLQYLLELQRDWARKSTYNAVIDLVVKYGGAYGIGAHYAGAMLKH